MSLTTFMHANWETHTPATERELAINQLETGHILYFPQLAFALSDAEKIFLNPQYVDPRAKNIGYHPESHRMWGAQGLSDQDRLQLKNMLARFAQQTLTLIQQLFPQYIPHLKIARTSLRPVEISNRKTSPRKDDKRLHVDAFPSAPNQGQRILRVFSNINPEGKPRIWRIGEPFEKVAQQFIPQVKKPLPGFRRALRLLKITKSYRTLYDHYMLHMHDTMKANDIYQQEAMQQEIHFAAGSTWIVQTDDVSHAAMQGQHVLEQTFSLPVHAMQNPARAPLRILENLLQKKLV